MGGRKLIERPHSLCLHRDLCVSKTWSVEEISMTLQRWRLFLMAPFLLLTLHSFLLAQSISQEQLTGTWIGVNIEWDTDFSCSLPTYIQLDADSAYHLGMVDGSAKEHTSTWAVHDERVRLDTIHFAPKLITLQNDLLSIGTNAPMVFRRFSDIPVDSSSTARQLSGHVWQSANLIIYLYENGQVSLENPATKQRTAHFWRLARFGQSVFLVIRGNQYNRDSGYKPLWQISNVSPKQMQAIGWNGCVVSTETFRLVRSIPPGDSCRPSGFQTCDNCFRRMWYETPLTRSAKRYDINQLFTKQYQPVEQVGQSGLVHIEFVVNCEGERGLFELSGFDDAYCPKTFDARITSQLLAICRDYVATDSSLRASNKPDTPDVRLQDVFVSLTFRLKDGRLTDILP